MTNDGKQLAQVLGSDFLEVPFSDPEAFYPKLTFMLPYSLLVRIFTCAHSKNRFFKQLIKLPSEKLGSPADYFS